MLRPKSPPPTAPPYVQVNPSSEYGTWTAAPTFRPIAANLPATYEVPADQSDEMFAPDRTEENTATSSITPT